MENSLEIVESIIHVFSEYLYVQPLIKYFSIDYILTFSNYEFFVILETQFFFDY